MSQSFPQHGGYSATHCWYYVLGGQVLSIKQIKDFAQMSEYKGYRAEEFEAIDRQPEPRRSQRLREHQTRFCGELKGDISGYRTAVRNLGLYRRNFDHSAEIKCAEGVHVAISLKTAHLYNDFVHLAHLHELLTKQGDFLDFL